MAIAPIDDAVGRVLGERYRLTRPIGTGTSAHVYAADDVRLRRRVAIKVLHPALAGDEAFLRRFRAEARAIAALRHPNILRVYDWGEDAGAPYLVMELLEGGSLRDLLDRGHTLSPAQVAALGADVCKALAHAHRRGLVHRDVKPANLIFDDDGRVAVADFGIARALAEASWTEPAGAVVGTARYAAPEQARGGTLTPAADVYALALVLVEAATGAVPFGADTTIATLMARVERPLEVPPELGPLRPVLEAAGKPDPAQRPGAAELAEALQDVARHLERPAPLPLAKPGADDVGGWASTGGWMDPTEYPGRPRLFDQEGRIAGAAGGASGASGAAGGAGGAGAASGAASGAGGAGAVPAVRPPIAPRRRRRLRKALVGGLLVALAAGGAAGALVETRALVPSHAVPSLLNDTTVQADAALSRLHLHLVVAGRQYDASAAAGTVIQQHPASGRLKEGDSVQVVLSLGPRPVAVPTNLIGLTYSQAQQKLSAVGLKIIQTGQQPSMTVAEGAIISTSPESGTLLPGQAVSVIVSSGKPFVSVPALSASASSSFGAASQALQAAGLGATEELAYSASVARGGVISTQPGPGSSVRVGTTVTVIVSKGPQMVTIPSVSGDSVAAATQLLTAKGLNVTGVVGNPTAPAINTEPAQGTVVAVGTQVQIVTG